MEEEEGESLKGRTKKIHGGLFHFQTFLGFKEGHGLSMSHERRGGVYIKLCIYTDH